MRQNGHLCGIYIRRELNAEMWMQKYEGTFWRFFFFLTSYFPRQLKWWKKSLNRIECAIIAVFYDLCILYLQLHAYTKYTISQTHSLLAAWCDVLAISLRVLYAITVIYNGMTLDPAICQIVSRLRARWNALRTFQAHPKEKPKR